MLRFDHMTVIAPTLEEGVDHLRVCLGIDLINSNTHSDMGTHNRRVKLGPDCYLEVIAVNPLAPAPASPRWFGLDQRDAVRSDWSSGFRLKGWVARTRDIDAVLASHGALFGSKRWLDDDFYFSVPPDGGLPMGGVLPSLIEADEDSLTATTLQDQGVRLREFVLEHPTPASVKDLYEAIGITHAPTVIEGRRIGFYARFDTPSGEKILR
jgi:Glyoxalase-like domain